MPRGDGHPIFSARLERRRQFDRLAVLAVLAVLAAGIGFIAIWAMQATTWLEAAEADRAPLMAGIGIALAVLIVLCLLVYAAVRMAGRSEP